MKIRLTWLCLLGFAAGIRSDDWPQWMGPNRNGVWAEKGIARKLPATLERKWTFPVRYGYSGPIVAAGSVFVMDYDADGDYSPNPSTRNKLSGNERLFRLDAKTGKEIWRFEYHCDYDVSYPAGPRASPTFDGDWVYTLGTMGHLTCVNGKNSEMRWQVDLKEKFGAKTQIWGFCAHPLVHNDKLYVMVGGKDSGVVCFNKKNGEMIWKKLDMAEPGYCPVSIIEAGGRKQLLVVTPENINGMDPENGETFWSVPFKPAYQMSICAPQHEGDVLFVTAEGDQAVALKLAAGKPEVTELWRGKSNTAVYPICGTPLLHKGYIYGVCSYGELRCVDLKTGKRVWTNDKAIAGGKRLPSGSAFIVRNDDRFFIAGENGDLILANLTPKKYEEIGRSKLIEPTGTTWGRSVVWSHPAFADQCVFARNDKEIVCVSLAGE